MEKGFLNPEEILQKLKLRENMIAADFGCGSGGWTLPLAKILKRGKVFAFDILEEPLSALSLKAKTDKIYNLEMRKCDVEEKVPLLSGTVDLVLMTNLLFEVKNKKKVLEEGKRILKEGGKILIVDWIKDNPLTKEIEWLDFKETKKIAKELNLKIENEFEAGVYHQGLVLVK
jgi:ubiquinone/menaquinone biosynthesis C-methylase UbiE